MIVIDSDAHSARTLAVIRYGVATARRGWLTKENVANTRTWRPLLSHHTRECGPNVTSRQCTPGIRAVARASSNG